MDLANPSTWRWLSALFALCFLLVVTAGPVEKFLLGKFGNLPNRHSSLSAVRYVLVHGLIITIFLGTFISVIVASITRREYWPFLVYHMYSHAAPNHFSRVTVYGSTRDGDILLREAKYTTPLVDAAVTSAVAKMQHQDNASERINRLAHSIYETYERRRSSGLHPGKEIQGIQIYQVKWKLVPGEVDQDAGTGQRVLLGEYPESQQRAGETP